MKRQFDVYRVTTCGDGMGEVSKKREFAGTTWAVSAAKARANVEYRERGKSLYGGCDEADYGGDAYMCVWYEAVER